MNESLRITRLPAVLANQIAAGEVVERPASVVKELVENAIDAGAGRIFVAVEEGGLGLIQVRDDGVGIAQDQLTLALSRHATSKLLTFEQLCEVSTLGFRGEALPSIASVARVRLVSRRQDDHCAWQVELDGASVTDETPQPANAPIGTTVEVRDLFFNTPARRRFMRTARTEYLKVEAVIRRTALAHPEVDLSLTRDGRPHLRARPATDAATERSRIRDLCGAAFADQAVSFERSSEAMRCYGWIAPPLQARASADVQHICVNGRVVRDPLLRHALRSAFDDAVAPGRHPAYVIYLDLPVADVDVNVHPTKHELRFHDARTVHDFVWSVVRDVAGINAQTNEDALTTAVRPSFDADDGAPPVSSETAPPHPMAFAAHPRQGSHRGQMQAYVKLTAQPPGRVGEEPADSEKVTLPLTPTIALRLTTRFALCRLPGGGHGFLDVAALASEATLATMTRPPVIAAPLLLPASKIVASAIMDALDEHATALGELGFGLRRLGPETMAIVEVPAILTHLPASELWLALEACAHPSVDVKVLIDLLRTAAAEVAPDLANADIQALFTIKSACDVALKPLTEATLLAFFQTSPR